MIVVWNSNAGQVYAFENVEAYKTFARETEGKNRTCWEDTVHDVGLGGEATGDNALEMTEFNISIT